MFTITSALNLKNERKDSPAFDFIGKQGTVFMYRNQTGQEEELCKERPEE